MLSVLEDHSKHEPPNAHNDAAAKVMTCLDDVCEWSAQVADYGWPLFGEFAQRLQSVRADLALSLDLEKACDCDNCPNATCESNRDEAVAQQVTTFLTRFDQFANELTGSHEGLESWQAACRRFQDLCCQYRELLSQTIR